MSKRLFVTFGQKAHRFEIKMNRYIAAEEPAHKQTKSAKLTEKEDQDDALYIKPLSDDAAFNKGVEWTSELFFLYSMMLFFGFYEMKKNYDKEEKAKVLTNIFETGLAAQKV